MWTGVECQSTVDRVRSNMQVQIRGQLDTLMNKVYRKFLLQWVTNVAVAVTVEMVYVAKRSEQLELHDSEHAGAADE